MSFQYYDNCHVKVYTNVPIGTLPSGSPVYDNTAMKLRNRIENEDRHIKFALPTAFCASNPQLFQPSFATTSYISLIDDGTGDVQAWFRIMEVGYELEQTGSDSYGPEYTFITCIPSNAWTPSLVNQAGLNLFMQYSSSNPITNSSNELLANNGDPVVNASGNLLATNALKDSSGSDGTSGQVLESTGTGTAWTTLPAASASILVESGSSTKISAMSNDASPSGSELFVVDNAGTNQNISLSQVASFVGGGSHGPQALLQSRSNVTASYPLTMSPATTSGLLVVSVSATVLSGTGTAVLTWSWTDENSASQTYTLATIGGSTTLSSVGYNVYPTMLIQSAGGSNGTLGWTITGSLLIDFAAFVTGI